MSIAIPVNFVPAPRRIDRRRRARIKLWLAIGSAYSVLLVVLLAVFQAMTGTTVQSLDNELHEVTAEIASTGKMINATAPALAESRLTLQASRAVGNQPDWSVLLALLTSRLNERVVLSNCSLTPVKGAQAATEPPTPRGARVNPARQPARQPAPGIGTQMPESFQLDARGMAKTQAALSAFVLQLEQTKLFAKVVLKDAQRVQFADGEAIQFHVNCILQGDEPSP